MKKSLYLLNIGNYAPELTALTYPWIHRYAEKIGAEVVLMTERKFPAWDMDYEKLQIYELAAARGDDWSLYIDSDTLVHPELPDVTELIPRDTVAHNGADFAALRWVYDDYFRRDGRHIGSCNWLALASSWCRDLWRPLDDLTFEEAAANIYPNVHELTTGIITREHLIDDYVLSRNIARFGLKFATINDMCKQIGWNNGFLHHVYKETLPRKVELAKIALKAWKLDTLFPEYEFLRQFEVRGEDNAPKLVSK